MKLINFFSSSNRRISLGLGLIKFFKAALSLFTVILSAKYFGTSSERDAWIIGGTVIAVLIQVIFGPINETFRAKYIHFREESSIQEVNDATDSLITFTIILGLLISIVAYIFPHLLSKMFAPGFSDGEDKILILMIKVLIPSFLILQITNFWSSMLNAYNSYYIPDLYSVVSLVLSVFILIILAPFIGIYSLVISSYVGSFLLFFVIYRELHTKYDYRFRMVWPTWTMIKPFIIFSTPLYVNYIFSQADIVIEKALTSTMSRGSISILDYAKKFIDLPVNVMIGIVTTVLTPSIAFLHIKNETNRMVDETQKYFRMVSLLLLPLVVLFVIVPKEIVSLVLLRGSFKVEQVELTSEVLKWLGIGVFYTSIYVIYSQILIGQKKIKLFSIVVIGTYLLKIAFNVLFYNTYNLITFPISWVLSQFIVSCLILYFGVKEFRERIISEVIKIHLVLIFMIALNYGFYNLLIFCFKDAIGRFLLLLLMIFSVLLSEIVLAYLFKIEEKQILTKYLSPNERKN